MCLGSYTTGRYFDIQIIIIYVVFLKAICSFNYSIVTILTKKNKEDGDLSHRPP